MNNVKLGFVSTATKILSKMMEFPPPVAITATWYAIGMALGSTSKIPDFETIWKDLVEQPSIKNLVHSGFKVGVKMRDVHA